MTSPYRSELTDLQQRYQDLRRELESRRTLEADQQTRCAELERELRVVDAQLRAAERRRSLPMLRTVDVATPCKADWNAMVGDEVTRFCGDCKRSVYNLSAMTAEQAEVFLQETFGSECIRFFRRADGTLITRDCSTTTSRTALKKVLVGSAAVAVAATAIAQAPATTRMCDTRLFSTPAVPPTEQVEMGQWTMGDPAPVEVMGAPMPVTPPVPVEPVQPKMGKIKIAPHLDKK